MSLSTEARDRLSAQQTALVRALMAGGEPPAHFDALRLGAATMSLARKRRRSAARAWPGLAKALRKHFEELFAAYAGAATLPRAGGSLADGREFARWLADRGELPESGQLQALAFDLRFTHNSNGLVCRRRPAFRVAWLRRSRRLIVGVRFPWFGVHFFPLFPKWTMANGQW
jgi:hypothetical protein